MCAKNIHTDKHTDKHTHDNYCMHLGLRLPRHNNYPAMHALTCAHRVKLNVSLQINTINQVILTATLNNLKHIWVCTKLKSVI